MGYCQAFLLVKIRDTFHVLVYLVWLMNKISLLVEGMRRRTPVPSFGATPVKSAALVFCEELNGAGGAGITQINYLAQRRKAAKKGIKKDNILNRFPQKAYTFLLFNLLL